jgi:hypothetical protein
MLISLQQKSSPILTKNNTTTVQAGPGSFRHRGTFLVTALTRHLKAARANCIRDIMELACFSLWRIPIHRTLSYGTQNSNASEHYKMVEILFPWIHMMRRITFVMFRATSCGTKFNYCQMLNIRSPISFKT